MKAKKTPDENLLDAQLDSILNAPQEEFEQYLTDSGVSLAKLSDKAASAFDNAIANHEKTKKAAEALANLSVGQQKVVAQNLHIRRNVMTAFREHRVLVTSIPNKFLTKLANELGLGQAADALAKALSGPAPYALGGQYKSDIKPLSNLEQVGFEQLLHEANMNDDEIKPLLE